MLRTRSKISTLLTATGLALASSVALTTPAHAATECGSSYNVRYFATPGENTSVSIRLCVQIIDGLGYRKVDGIWRDGSGSLEIDKFDNFDIHLQLERNDAVYWGNNNIALDLTAEINGSESGSFSKTLGPSYSSTGGKLPSGKWTTDGFVNFDINNDGEGGNNWSLTGSPSIAR
ncbi:hypothetical protein ACQF36_30715 [Streptomyces sp. Marseille-Q5077]|uniref:hypothetical protein n=1 Tax=Streptomyces sp. Marseille-Q5077 TaxID=3418995 RepID=UPI003CFD0169